LSVSGYEEYPLALRRDADPEEVIRAELFHGGIVAGGGERHKLDELFGSKVLQGHGGEVGPDINRFVRIRRQFDEGGFHDLEQYRQDLVALIVAGEAAQE